MSLGLAISIVLFFLFGSLTNQSKIGSLLFSVAIVLISGAFAERLLICSEQKEIAI